MPSVIPDCQSNKSFVLCSLQSSSQVVMMSRSSGCFCGFSGYVAVISIPFTCWSLGASGCVAVKVLH